MTHNDPDQLPEALVEDVADECDKPVKGGFPIVGIGASAGGLEAFTQLLKALPADTGMGFVLVQHLAPTHASALAEILSRATPMPVREVHQGSQVEPNHVYVIPPGQNMVLTRGALQLLPREARGQHRPIDQFFRALAEEQGPQAIGVVLSGTASDGTLGLEAIKAEGGITFAQDATAQHEGMPHSAIASGCVDFVLPPGDIARELVRIGKHPYAAPLPGLPEPSGEPNFAQIVQLLHQAWGVDFSHYRFNTLYRRVTRRMVLLKMEGLSQYVQLLRETPAEVEALYQDILINVTSFFRDPESFEALQSKVFPRLLQDRSRNDPVRVWTLGCSTGQEAYSLAMAFLESAEALGSHAQLQIFATDLNAAGIEKARAGVYSKDIAQDVSPERLRRFFAEVDGCYRISKAIRDACVFSRHNVLADPPFSRIDLISCRNLLIYLQPVLQQRIVPTLHYALKPAGYLWLGSSETVGGYQNLFEPDDVKHKIYARKPGCSPGPGHFPLQHGGAPRPPFAPIAVRSSGGVDLPREADRILLTKFAPPSVLVTAELELLQYRGDTGAYLAPAPGKASLSLLKMLREGLLVPVRAAILRAGKEQAPVREEGLQVKSNGGYHAVAVEVIPLRRNGGNASGFLILFEEAGATGAEQPPAGTARDRGPDAAGTPRPTLAVDPDTARLEQELSAAREYLQSVIEGQEAANEELQAANEEVQSANEELQSINEELETSKEEIQSSNEELATVNDELNHRNVEVNRVNNDLVNLLGSVQMAIVMLGPDLRVRRFTPMAEKVLNLIPSDVGRPLSDLKLKIDLPDLESLLTEVFDTVSSKERDVQDQQGRWYSLRLRPYKTLDNKIDGVVLLLVDVDAIKRAHAFTASIVATVREPLLVLDADLRVQTASRSFYQCFRVMPEDTENRLLYQLGNGQWDIPELRRLLEEVLSRDNQISDFEVEHRFEYIGTKTMLLNARRLIQAEDQAPLILLAVEDVTERNTARKAQRESEQRFRALFDLGPVAVYSCDLSGRIEEFNRRAVELWGREPQPGDTDERFCGSFKMYLPDGASMPHEDCPMAEVLCGKIPAARDVEVHIERPDGSRITVIVNIVPLKNERGETTGAINCFYDITERIQAENLLRESEQRLRIALSAAQMGTWRWDIPTNTQTTDENLSRMCGLPFGVVRQPLGGFLGIIHAEDRARVEEAFARSVREGTDFSVEFRVAWPDGTVRWLKDQGDVFKDEGGQPLYMTGACVDITLLKHAEEDLQKASDELERKVGERTRALLAAKASLEEQFAQRQHLLRRLASAEEEQRSRIARELHDQMGQVLTALLLGLKSLEATQTVAPEQLRRLQEFANQIGQEAHRIARELRPTVLDDLGLHTALLNYAEEWSGRSRIRVDVHSSGLEAQRLPLELETAVYRIVQEALTNVLRHAQASHVSVIVERRKDLLLLIVEDDGSGFDVDAATDPRSSRRLGLLGMRERAALLGGTLEIESNPGKGTTVYVRIPWSVPEQGETGE